MPQVRVDLLRLVSLLHRGLDPRPNVVGQLCQLN